MVPAVQIIWQIGQAWPVHLNTLSSQLSTLARHWMNVCVNIYPYAKVTMVNKKNTRQNKKRKKNA